MEVAWQVEIDEWCRKVLTKHWPNVPKHGDIHEVGKHNLESVDLICGGFPCQPYSQAGKQRGKDDDRHLWPEMFRVIKGLKPGWVIGENVAGIISMELDNCISDLESEGYSCQSFIIPACGIEAPHRRNRVWIVAHTNNSRCKRGISRMRQKWEDGYGEESDTQQIWSRWPDNVPTPHFSRGNDGISPFLDEIIRSYGYENVNNKDAISKIDFIRGKILRELWAEQRKTQPTSHREETRGNKDSLHEVPYSRAYERWKLGQRIKEDKKLCDMWKEFHPKPLKETQILQQRMLERIREIECTEEVVSERTHRIKGLGNAVVPQIPEIIGRAIMEIEGLTLSGNSNIV